MKRLVLGMLACNALGLATLLPCAAMAAEGPPPDAPPAVEPAAVPAFDQLDVDGDRSLTLGEVPEHTRLFRDFARWDANKDGVLNVPEFNRYVEQLAQL